MTEPVYLTHAHGLTGAGMGIAAALGALEAGMQVARRHPNLQLPGREGEPEPVTYVTALDKPGADRSTELADALLEQLPAAADGVWLAGALAQGEPAEWLVRDGRDGLASAFEALDTGDSLAAAIATAGQSLAARGWESAWLLVADSRVAPSDIMAEEGNAGVLRQTLDGRLPGEAAVALRLARTAPADAAPSLQAEVPARSGEASTSADGSARAASLRAALERTGVGADRIGAIFADGPADLDDRLAWSNCLRSVWPGGPSAETLHAMELGLIEPVAPGVAHPPHKQSARVLGGVGRAGLALQIALAAQWRRRQQRWAAFDLAEAPGPVLACEQPDSAPLNPVIVD